MALVLLSSTDEFVDRMFMEWYDNVRGKNEHAVNTYTCFLPERCKYSCVFFWHIGRETWEERKCHGENARDIHQERMERMQKEI